MQRVTAPAGPLRYAVLAVTALGSAVITLPVELVGWLAAGPPLAQWFGLSLLADVPGHLVLIVPLRFWLQRPRPTPFERAPLGFDVWNLWSFPSAHSLRTWTLAAIWCNALPTYWYVFVGAATVITGTRIVLRRHFPSDIVVGGLFGLAWGAVLVRWLPGGMAPPW